MLGMKKAILGLGCCYMISAAHAEVYKWTDSRGATHYSQTPPTSQDAGVIGARKADTRGDAVEQLFQAIRDNNSQQVRRLLDKGLHPDTRNRAMQTPLIYAASINQSAIIHLLARHGADINASLRGQTALYTATSRGHIDSVKALLERGANLNLGDETAGSPLMVAIDKRYEPIALFLIRHGARLDSVDLRGQTPLVKAIHVKNPALVREILRRGSDSNQTDKSGDTPLMHAACCATVEIAQLLLSAGAKADSHNQRGQTAIDKASLAANHGVVELLRKESTQKNK